MTKLTVFSMVILIANHAIADIIVQPGYGQPHSTSQSHATQHQHQQQEKHAMQTSESLPASELEVNHQYMDPGYHLELYPVYTDAYHIPAYAVSPLFQHLMPPMSKAAQRRLIAGHGDYGVAGIPAAIPPEYYNYPNTAVHSRRRRSNTEELDTAAQRDKRDKDDVATKPSLDDDKLSIVDLQNQDEKHVNTRQSMTGTLLGLNPSNMYPMYQYRTKELDPNFNSHQEIGSQQTLGQINSRAATQQQISTQPQAAGPAQIAIPRINIADLQHAMLLQQSAPQQQQQQQQKLSEYRNAPDPRPLPASVEPTPVERSKEHSEPRTSTASKHTEVNGDEEMVGTKLGGAYKVKVVQHMHQHSKFKDNKHKPGESHTNANPSNVVHHNDGAPNNLAQVQPDPQQVVYVYQLPGAQPTNYPSNAQYVVMPQTYPVNQIGNYVWNNPLSSSPSTFRICFESSDSAQPMLYQIA